MPRGVCPRDTRGLTVSVLRRKGAQDRIGDLERQVAEAGAQALESEAEKSELAAAAAAAEAEITRLNARIAELVKERRSAGDGRD